MTFILMMEMAISMIELLNYPVRGDCCSATCLRLIAAIQYRTSL